MLLFCIKIFFHEYCQITDYMHMTYWGTIYHVLHPDSHKPPCPSWKWTNFHPVSSIVHVSLEYYVWAWKKAVDFNCRWCAGYIYFQNIWSNKLYVQIAAFHHIVVFTAYHWLSQLHIHLQHISSFTLHIACPHQTSVLFCVFLGG
jgi:hypothetical protein